MTIIEDTTLLDITAPTNNNFQIFDGAQSYEDYDDVTTLDSEEDMVTIFRSYDGR